MSKRKKRLDRIRQNPNNVSLEDYMTLPYTIELTPDVDGFWFAEIPLLEGCMTNGENWNDTLDMIEDAKRAWLMTALDMGFNIPEPEAN